MLELQKHLVNEAPHIKKDLLMLIDVGAEDTGYVWTVGFWSGKEWHCPFDGISYNVIEWYELPQRDIIEEDFSDLQRKIEDFWYER